MTKTSRDSFDDLNDVINLLKKLSMVIIFAHSKLLYFILGRAKSFEFYEESPKQVSRSDFYKYTLPLMNIIFLLYKHKCFTRENTTGKLFFFFIFQCKRKYLKYFAFVSLISSLQLVSLTERYQIRVKGVLKEGNKKTASYPFLS